MKNFLISVLILLCAAFHADAQSIKVNTRFGKVSKEEVEMTTYDKDTSANALVLYEHTDLFMNINAAGRFALSKKKHLRIKVLKEEGIDRGDFEMLYYNSSAYKEVISGIDVITYNMVEGKVVETKMPKKYIFNEEYSENYRKISFSAQEVKVGSVIEVKYEITNPRYWMIDDIYFQKTIPVNLAEASVRIPEYFTFNKKMNGYLHIDYTKDISSSAFPVAGGSLTYSLNIDNYRLVDAPAFRVEPYVYNSSQYLSAVHYDIRSLSIPGAVYEDYSVNWTAVDKNYLDSDLMTRFRGNCQFKDQVKAIPAELTDEEKIAAAVKIVKDAVEWDESYSIMPEPLAQTVKARTGSNSDLNCLLAGCLRELGFTVDPVFIKMRSSGILMDYQPEMNPYDTFILCVTSSDGTSRYLDCGPSEGYINILDPEMLIKNGRLMNSTGSGQWVDLTKLCRSGLVMNVSAAVDPATASATGNVSLNYFGVDSFEFKSYYNSFEDEEEYITDLENDHSVEIQEIEIKKKDEYSKDASVLFTYSKSLDSTGEIIYINPFFEKFHSKETFQSPTRDYPVDFPYPYTVKYGFNLQIPEGYAVDQLPQSVLMKLEALDATVRLIAKAAGNIVQISYTYTQNKTLGEVQHYDDIRTFWQNLGDIYDSMIVLKKI